MFCSLLCLSFAFRELDVERLDVHSVFKLLGSGTGRNIILGLAFTTLIVYAATKFSYYKKACIMFSTSKPGILLISAGLLLIVGCVFEENESIIQNVFFEEIFELGGYSLIFLSAIGANSFVPPQERKQEGLNAESSQ